MVKMDKLPVYFLTFVCVLLCSASALQDLEELQTLLPTHLHILDHDFNSKDQRIEVDLFSREENSSGLEILLELQARMLNPYLFTIPDSTCKRDFEAFYDGLRRLDFAAIAS